MIRRSAGLASSMRRDFSLFDDAVGIRADAGIEEKLADIFEAGGAVVQVILAGAIAVEPAADRHFVHIKREHAGAVFALRDFQRPERLQPAPRVCGRPSR